MHRSDLVRASLEAHRPADEQEQLHRSRCLRLIEQADDAFARGHFSPGHFTASAFVLSSDGRSLLLVHHRKLGRWLQPGGHFEPQDDSLLAAARREVAEETGIVGVVEETDLFDVYVHTIPPHGSEPAHEHFDLRVLLRARQELGPLGHEVHAAAWYGIEDIDAELTDASVVRALTKLGVRA